MTNWPVHATWNGPIVMIGFGSIGRGTLPLILRHIDCDRKKITVIDPDDSNAHLVDKEGIAFIKEAVTKRNYKSLLTPLLTAGPGQAFIVNLSVDVDRRRHQRLASETGALYIDTVIEPWPGFYYNSKLDNADAHQLCACARRCWRSRRNIQAATRRSPAAAPIPAWCRGSSSRRCSTSPTDLKLKVKEPKTREEWGKLMKRVGVKGIHIAERDTQRSKKPEAARHFRQYLVGRRLHFGRPAAGRTRLGHA